MPRSLILSGGGAYADAWHPFAATSERIAAILAEAGHQVEIAEDVADHVADLRGWDLRLPGWEKVTGVAWVPG